MFGLPPKAAFKVQGSGFKVGLKKGARQKAQGAAEYHLCL